MRVILDTNIWISFLFGKQLHDVADIFGSYNIQVYVSPQLLTELQTVVSRDKIRKHIHPQSI